MGVEKEENGKKDARIIPFVKAASAEVKYRQQEMEPFSRKYYVAEGMQYAFLVVQAILELAGEVADERLSAFIDGELDMFLN